MHSSIRATMAFLPETLKSPALNAVCTFASKKNEGPAGREERKEERGERRRRKLDFSRSEVFASCAKTQRATFALSASVRLSVTMRLVSRNIVSYFATTHLPMRRILSDVSIHSRPGLSVGARDQRAGTIDHIQFHVAFRDEMRRRSGRLSGSILARASATTYTLERGSITVPLLPPLSSA